MSSIVCLTPEEIGQLKIMADKNISKLCRLTGVDRKVIMNIILTGQGGHLPLERIRKYAFQKTKGSHKHV